MRTWHRIALAWTPDEVVVDKVRYHGDEYAIKRVAVLRLKLPYPPIVLYGANDRDHGSVTTRIGRREMRVEPGVSLLMSRRTAFGVSCVHADFSCAPALIEVS